MVGMTLSFSLVTLLYKQGKITKAEMDDLFQGVLETLENSPLATDPAVGIARVLIDGMAQVAATGGTLAPKANRT
jgi:hypothetical protein